MNLRPNQSKNVDLISGDRLVLYTDGFIEVFNKCDEMLGIEGLEELVRGSAKKSLPEMKQLILDGVAAWRHGPLTNDMSLVLSNFVRSLRATGARAANPGFDGDSEDAGLSLCRITSN